MKNNQIIKPILISTIISLSLCAGTIGYMQTTLANTEQNTLKSKGIILYTDPETGEEILIDTNDHKILQTSIENLDTDLNLINTTVDGLNTNYDNIIENIENIETDVNTNTERIDTIKRYQKYVNTELDYGYFVSSELQRDVTDIVDIDARQEGNIEINNGLVSLKANKTYKIAFGLYGKTSGDNDTYYSMYNDTSSEFIGNTINCLPVNYPGLWNSQCCSEMIYTPSEDCEICIKYTGGFYFTELHKVYVTVQEIGREITIDPVEYVDQQSGLQDTPVGQVINYLGNTAPQHYLVCDGSTYNINEYPYLAEHIKTEFGKYNHFGGDGETTFAVPDLRNKFLKGSAEAGVYEEAGLPNIQGTSQNLFWTNNYKGTGAFSGNKKIASNNNYSGDGYGTTGEIVFNASKSNPIYGNSDTVTPENISVLYCIKAEPTYFMVYNEAQ